MIKIALPNKSNILNSKTVENYMKQEAEKNKTTYSSHTPYQNPMAINASNAYKQYCQLYGFASKPYNQFSIRDGFKIFFYEWSDLTKEPRVFTTKTAFLQFLNEAGIVIDDTSKDRLSMGTYGIYASCIKDTNKIIVQYTFCSLVGAWGVASYGQPEEKKKMTTKEEIMARDSINFRFYEMSDIHRQPIVFTSWKVWMVFMAKYGLKMSSHNEKRLKALDKPHYGTCIPGYPVVAARSSREKLEEVIHQQRIAAYDA